MTRFCESLDRRDTLSATHSAALPSEIAFSTTSVQPESAITVDVNRGVYPAKLAATASNLPASINVRSGVFSTQSVQAESNTTENIAHGVYPAQPVADGNRPSSISTVTHPLAVTNLKAYPFIYSAGGKTTSAMTFTWTTSANTIPPYTILKFYRIFIVYKNETLGWVDLNRSGRTVGGFRSGKLYNFYEVTYVDHVPTVAGGNPWTISSWNSLATQAVAA